jgi:hypothetical protein
METSLKAHAGRDSRAYPYGNRPSDEPLPTREMVERRAYEIWQRHGCPSDTAFHDWLAAEAELRSRR